MSEESTSEEPFVREVRLRVPLPIVIPIGAVLLIAAVTIGLSRILLSVPSEVAVIIALAVAANVLIASAFVASRPDSARRVWPELLIVFLYPFVVGLVLAQLNLGEGAAATETEAKGEPAAGGLSVTAENVSFNTDELEIKAGEEAQLEFSNADASSVSHNLALYDKEGGKEIFKGDIIPGGQSTTYSIPPLEKGEATYFQCDVHPGMNGTVKVQ